MDRATYDRLYAESLQNPEAFWAREAKRLEWISPWKEIVSPARAQFSEDGVVHWFRGGALNASVNCVDRHAVSHPDRIAILWEPDAPNEKPKSLTYRELLVQVSRAANALKTIGVKKGDRVSLYMPMIPEAAIAMLACTRIGAVHSVVFGGFSPEALAGRIRDCGSTWVITADEGRRGGKTIPLKANVDAALANATGVKKVIVVRSTGGTIPWSPQRDLWYGDLLAAASDTCEALMMDSEDPLFILYTSGSTGKPKGLLHTTGGYLVYAAITYAHVFDVRPDEVYWCTADVGWITGHTYIVYGPLLNGSTILMYEGIPTHPDASRFWQIVDRHKVNVFYTAPTALRSLEREGDGPVLKTSRQTLRILGSVGEPINSEAWNWYHDVIGNKKCPIVDTWWQTETGGILISPLPGVNGTDKPGCASLPFFGVEPAILSLEGKEVLGEGTGTLVMKRSWPGQARTIYGDPARYTQTYFKPNPGYFFTGDGCSRDAAGDYWIGGRVDDVIKVSGHRLGTAEIESAIDTHDSVVESAVVGMPHPIKGEGIYAFVTLMAGIDPNESISREIIQLVRKVIGPIATPDRIQFAPALPKTRSGKIMRRILRKIAVGHTEDLGDISTLADPRVVADLVAGRSPS